MKWTEYSILLVLVATVGIIAFAHYVLFDESTEPPREIPRYEVSEEIPDFRSIGDVKTKKSTFFDFLLPMIRNANADVREDRDFLMVMQEKEQAGESLTDSDQKRINSIREAYKFDEDVSISEMLIRVDVVPASLVLAQAANESAWGTSRFARNANNYFGLWCFKRGCGLAPREREEGLHHEVASFDTVADSVEYYIYNINTHAAYKGLRKLRAERRAEGDNLEGTELAEGLIRYSERGGEYVDEIQSMIRFNELEAFNLGLPDNVLAISD